MQMMKKIKKKKGTSPLEKILQKIKLAQLGMKSVSLQGVR